MKERNIITTTIIRNKHFPFIELKEGGPSVYAVRKHSHDELSCGFVEKGCTRIICKTRQLDLGVNQATLLPPDTIHLCQPYDEHKFKFKMLYINSPWFLSIFKLDPWKIAPQIAQLKTPEIQYKNRFFYNFGDIDTPLKAESDTIFFIEKLLFNVFDLSMHQALQTEIKTSTLAAIKNYIDQHFTEQILLEDLAALSRKNKFSILRKFKTVYKLTPHAYQLNKKINHAKQLLLEGETTAQTAAICGFFDQSHFIKTFRQYVGMNPIDYK